MRLRADLTLLFVTVLWGSAFVVMRVAAGHGTIFFLNGLRFLLGALLLQPFAKLRGAFNRTKLGFVDLEQCHLFPRRRLEGPPVPEIVSILARDTHGRRLHLFRPR